MPLTSSTQVQDMQFEFAPGYTVPDLRLVTEYVRHVEDLPVQHTPDVLGLHPNAEIKLHTENASKVFELMLSMPSPDDASSLAGDIEPEGRDDVVARRARCFTF